MASFLSLNRTKSALFVAAITFLTFFSIGGLAHSAPSCQSILSSARSGIASALISREFRVIVDLGKSLEQKMKNEPENADLLEKLQISLSKAVVPSAPELQKFSRTLVEIASRRSQRSIIKKNDGDYYVMFPISKANTIALSQMRTNSDLMKELRTLMKDYQDSGVKTLQLMEFGSALNEVEILRLLTNEVFPIGIVTEDLRADGNRMTPAIFYVHDVAHAEGILVNVKSAAQELKLTLPQAWTLVRGKLSQVLDLISQEKDPMMRWQMELVVFYETHEANNSDVMSNFISKKEIHEFTKTDLEPWFEERLDTKEKEKLSTSGHKWPLVFKNLDSILKKVN